jgi:bile acid:Na+ symporter, BASS family
MQTIDILVSSVLALIMFGIGLSLTLKDFTNIALYPKAFITALTSQMIALPLIAFAVASFFDVSAEIKVGLVILAASPGGATSGFITHLFKGNVALSLSLTAVNSFLTLFSIPFIVNLALKHFLGQQSDIVLPFWDTFFHIFFIALIPAFCGVMLRRYRTDWAVRIEKPAKYVMMFLLFSVFTIKIFAGESSGGSGLTKSDFREILPPALLLNFICLMVGYFLLKAVSLKHPDSLTAAIESGVHNTTLAFLIAGTLLQNETMVKPPLIYSMFSFWTALLFGFIASKLTQHKIDFL